MEYIITHHIVAMAVKNKRKNQRKNQRKNKMNSQYKQKSDRLYELTPLMIRNNCSYQIKLKDSINSKRQIIVFNIK